MSSTTDTLTGQQQRMLMSFQESCGGFRQRFWNYDKPKALKDLIEMGFVKSSHLGLGWFQLTEKGKELIHEIEREAQ